MTGLALSATRAGAILVRSSSGQVYGLHTPAGVNPATVPGAAAEAQALRAQRAAHGSARVPFSAANGNNMDYGGGPVLHATAPYLVFWDPNGAIPASSRSLFEQFFTDKAADSGKSTNVYAVPRQYNDPSGFVDYRQSFSPNQIITASDPYPGTESGCPVNSAQPTGPVSFDYCVADDQIQSELSQLISSRGLPTGVRPVVPVYFVVLPPDANVCDDTSTSTCATNNFCEYHAAFPLGGSTVVYAVIPQSEYRTNMDPKRCQGDGSGVNANNIQEPNGDQADVSISALHVPGAGTYQVKLAPSAAIKRALAKGKTLHVAATITFHSARGGTPSSHVRLVTVKGRKKAKRRH